MNSAARVLARDSSVRDYFELLKPRVMSLVVFTGLVGLLLAPGHIHPFLAFIAILCIAFGSGAAGAINMWYEREIDAKMKRTQNRPLPTGRVEPQNAIEFAVAMAVASVLIMAVSVNLAAAFLLLTAILFYVFIYTIWLKPRTPQNIVIGGAAGAFPPVIGWAAVTGTIDLFPLILFMITFMWTPPHFWALALYRSDDYKKAGIPMLPVVSGIKETKKQILLYAILLFPVALLPVFFGFSGVIYLTAATLLSLSFIWQAVKVFRDNGENANKTAFAMFKFSIAHLFLLYISILLDHFYKTAL